MNNEYVKKTVNKPIDIPLEHYLKLYHPPFFCEPKWDGERVLIQVSDRIVIANKHHSIYEEEILPERLIQAIRKAFTVNGIYDAEFFSLKGNLYDFLSARANLTDDLALAIWDIITDFKTDFRNIKLEERKGFLKDAVQTNDRVILVESELCSNKEEILRFFEDSLEEGFEGIVVKPNSNYYAKWLKIKEQYTDDFAVLGVKKTESYLKDGIPFTFLVGIYQNGKWIPIGDVSSGLSYNEREAIAEFIDELKIREDRNYIYFKPDLVFEVEYHQKTENGLREPKIKRIRFDKAPTECRTLQSLHKRERCRRG